MDQVVISDFYRVSKQLKRDALVICELCMLLKSFISFNGKSRISFGILSDCESSVFPSLYPTDYVTMFIVYCPFNKTCYQNLFVENQMCDSWPAMIANLVLVQAFFLVLGKCHPWVHNQTKILTHKEHYTRLQGDVAGFLKLLFEMKLDWNKWIHSFLILISLRFVKTFLRHTWHTVLHLCRENISR